PVNTDTKRWIEQDKKHCWHPFTAQSEWCAPDFTPLMLCSGKGIWLTDSEGRSYIDGNSSIWTNIHGHCQEHIVAAMKAQLDKVAHTSYLGFANPLASELATRLCAFFPENTLTRVFFSDDGSTALESAIKMERQFRMQTGQGHRRGFIAFDNCYHGDTMGAAMLGGVGLYFSRFQGELFPVTHIRNLDELKALPQELLNETAALVIEPVVQGVNRINVWPEGMLRELREWTEQQGIHLILDEVMTGYGRTGYMFACLKEEVIPDFLCTAKGLTSGYTPLAATFTKEFIYDGFCGEETNAFFYGHSFTAHQVGCAAAMASLDVFEQEKVLESLPAKIDLMHQLAQQACETSPYLTGFRQAGMVMGVDIVQQNGSPYPKEQAMGSKACLAMRAHGLLTRPILDTIVVMPPLCITAEELRQLFDALVKGVHDACCVS
ncbi:MAG: adenosylmethionine--8-amino-7-oxononanoate transaminase, partial [Akkermansia sp.]